MSLPHRAKGVKVLKAVSSTIRLNILNLLFDKGALSYTELMNQLKMNPSRDAGRFAYHLKFLLKASLVEADAEAKKYLLTDLGKMVIDIAERVERKALKPRGMLVRTSHSTLEEFDANKIANSLIREAKMPADLAQKAAKETEKILLKAKTKYVTAPLIREIVNAILIEKGLEEYRHKLTRLGMPVHEVTALIDGKDNILGTTNILNKAATNIFSEYTLLNVFPRDIADAHVSGAIHVNNLGTWLLKPSEVMHDLRFFFQNGVRTTNPLQLSTKPPQTFEAALATIFNALLQTNQEINENQTCDHFNIFLAPFTKGIEPTIIKENIRIFLLNINQNINATFCLDTKVPKLLADKPAIGPEGKTNGKYGDFTKEAQLLASLTIDLFAEESNPKPLLNPKIIIRINNETLTDEDASNILLKAHNLAAEKGILYFANMPKNEEIAKAFSSTGIKLEADLTTDWETDTLRTGCLGTVAINLQRIVQESEREKTKFFQILKERYELASRCLEIKQRALKQHAKNSLPFMTQSTNGDTYFRLENCSSIINLAGLKEATENFCPQTNSNEENLKFIEEIIQNILSFKQKLGRKHGKRVFPAILPNQEASERLAQLDIEKYGVAKIKFSGNRDKPFYSTAKRIQLQPNNVLAIQPKSLELDQRLKGLNTGANLIIIELEEYEYKPEDLMNFTKQLMEKETIELFTYNRKTTYCSNCKKSWTGTLHKCPQCGAVSTITLFDRFDFT